MRIVIQQPDVVPGLAQIHIRVLSGNPDRVTVLPLHESVDRSGAPRPDLAKAVPGQAGLYEAELWFMRKGAYGVEVAVEGEGNGGVLMIPVNSLATEQMPLPPWLGAVLSGLGLLLVLGVVGIAVAAIRESTLSDEQSVKGGWIRSLLAGAAGLMVALGLLYGGAKWWSAEEVSHQKNQMFQPFEIQSTVEPGESGYRWIVELTDARWQRQSLALLPDHGKLIHAFLIEDRRQGTEEGSVQHALDFQLNTLGSATLAKTQNERGALGMVKDRTLSESGMAYGSALATSDLVGPHFVHLHPVPMGQNATRFESVLPGLPAGSYWAFLDVTHETGLSQTLVHRLTLEEPTLPILKWADRDDSRWHPLQGAAYDEAPLGDDLWMRLELREDFVANEPILLSFVIRHATGRPVVLEPYLRMLGHAVVMKSDGSVFSHLHPSGNLSMAAARRFTERNNDTSSAQQIDAICGDLEAVSPGTRRALLEGARLGFPYLFPGEGSYWLWVQIKIGGIIRTGCFKLQVAGR
jgi:hypothetical protein